MGQIVLSKREAAVRAADEQVEVLLDIYRDPERLAGLDIDSDFVRERIDRLRELQDALRRQLEANDLLPRQPDPETRNWDFFVDHLRGVLDQQPNAVPLAEEQKLLEHCEALLSLDPPPDPGAVREGLASTERATRQLAEE